MKATFCLYEEIQYQLDYGMLLIFLDYMFLKRTGSYNPNNKYFSRIIVEILKYVASSSEQKERIN